MTANLGYFTMPVRDLERGKRFYAGVLGWKFDAHNESPGYSHVNNVTPPGGLNTHDGSDATIYFRVADIHSAVARVREHGGHADDPQKSNSGWHTACTDDQGTRFSLWQPAEGY
jgi:uncharacterized protein